MVYYDLAFALGYKIEDILEMPYEVMCGWMDYFDRYPAGWREDNRTYMLLRAQGAKGKPWDYFPGLKKVFEPKDAKPTDTLRGSAMFQRMLSAVGGDQPDFLKEMM